MEKDILKQLQKILYEDIKHDALVDVNKIDIDTNKDITERLEKFINDVKNPYIIKCVNTIVQIEFSDSEKSIDNQIKSYLKAFKTSDLSC
ncbi:MAG: hypothetical protein RR646_02080 [Erysipelotrichaceae bacterium]